MLIESEIVDEGIDGEAVEVQRPYVVVVGPTKLENEHHVASGHAQHPTWWDACVRARGIAGGHERREPSRENEDPPVAIDCDGTEDDDDDDDEMTQNKLLILVAKDVKTGTYAASCLRKKIRGNTSRHGWCLWCVDLSIAERYCTVMESHRS